MVPYWEKFERVEIFSSIDGMEDVGHYVRYPAKWDVVEKNIRKIDQLSDKFLLRLLYSVNALNVHHLPGLFAMGEKSEI
jgi:sulfatase maturation enzyme AslB (radical SAM superfamily)